MNDEARKFAVLVEALSILTKACRDYDMTIIEQVSMIESKNKRIEELLDLIFELETKLKEYEHN